MKMTPLNIIAPFLINITTIFKKKIFRLCMCAHTLIQYKFVFKCCVYIRISIYLNIRILFTVFKNPFQGFT